MQNWSRQGLCRRSRAESLHSTSPLLPHRQRRALRVVFHHTHTNARLVCLGRLSHRGTASWPTGRLFPSRRQSRAELFSCRIRTGADGSSTPLLLPGTCAGTRAGGRTQHPHPPTPPARPEGYEHNFSWVLTFSTSSLQSCRGHRATGKEISVGGVEKHLALTPAGKATPWTQQANSRDKLALHPAATARSMPFPSFFTLELSFTMGEQVHATRASRTPAPLPARAVTATAFSGPQEEKC